MLGIMIASLATIAIGRYLSLAESTRNLRFEMLANHFAKGAANLRVNWIIQNHVKEVSTLGIDKQMTLGDQLIYFSSQGWPMGITKSTGTQFVPNPMDCYQLWQVLLQNPPPIAQMPPKKSGRHEYYIAVEKGACRYYWNKDGSQNYYFEYRPWDGKVSLVIPE